MAIGLHAIAGLAGTIAVAIKTPVSTMAEASASSVSLACWGKVDGTSIDLNVLSVGVNEVRL